MTRELWFYAWLSRFSLLNYRAKIMVMAFIGTHIPLIALASYFAFQSAPDWATFVTTVGITLVATLIGTGLTLFVLNELLRPVVMTSKMLRTYRGSRARSPLPTHFTDEVGTLMADADQTIDHLDKTLDVLEHIDDVTGLPNRKRFVQRLTQRIGQRGTFSVAVLRFASFQRIAQTLDLKRADDIARTIAERLATHFTHGELVARITKVEFAVLIEDDAMPFADSVHELRDVLTSCTDDVKIDGFDIKPEVYAGLAVFPEDAADAETLLGHASAAAAQAIDRTPMLHSPAARAAAIEQLRIEHELRRALDNNEFALHYQPIISAREGKAIGAEALIRWNHPARGLLPPGAFIAAAEASGLINPMGLWVMRETCAQLRRWSDAGRGNLRAAVNLSARQFLDPNLNRHVRDAIDNAGIRPDQLEIELTETAAMADAEHTRRMFTSLRDDGISIAIDDFGTGYASMSYLRKLPFDKLKIDREFVADVHKQAHSQAICNALIELSKGLGLAVLAEGVECEDEVRYLTARGCNLFQGYYFAKPLAHGDFERTVDSIALNAVLAKMKGDAAQPRREALSA